MTKINKVLCIGLITKNVAKYLPLVLRTSQQYAALFSESYTCIVDGWSTDATKILAQSWCKSDPDHRCFMQQPSNNLSRMPSIVEARNTVLNYFRPKFEDNVYLLLLDADNVSASPFDQPGFLRAFSEQCPYQWSAMFPNQRKQYYDIYALRERLVDENYQYRHSNLNWYDGSMLKALKQYEHPRSDPSGFYEVQSAFGGAGLYNTKYLQHPDIIYDWNERWTPKPDYKGNPQFEIGQSYTIDCCEHVCFHARIREHQAPKMYINCEWYNCD
jgi:hypothetical protein